jgi:transcription initiation factor TFIID TATA-box-binding protein
MLYASGKYSLAGAKSVSEAREVNERFIQQLEQMLREKLDDREFEVRYLVGTADTGTVLDLNRMSISLGMDKIEYEPEQFPGLFYRPSGQDWFCILFSSGKAVFSGAQNKEELRKISSEVSERIDELF